MEKDKECKEEKKVPGLTDAELLCCDIAIHIAHKTAARFEDMADGMEMSTLKQIVRRIEDADPESVVPMLQAMFLARGMVDIAEDLDMLELCSKYDEDTYFVFFDILFDTDIFEWFSIENMAQFMGREIPSIRRSVFLHTLLFLDVNAGTVSGSCSFMPSS